MSDFLLEIGVEEIPDWMIEPALEDLRSRFEAAFSAFGGKAITTDATPRRLVLQIENLVAQAPDVESVVQGPHLSAGPKAAEGFAKKQNTTVDQLAKMTDAKGERYIFSQLVKGQSAAQALAEKLPEIITGLHFPKTMYWTGKGGVKFIRPIRWLVALLDDQIIPFEIAGVKSGNTTRGHRVLGSKSPVLVGINTYAQALRANFVIVSAEERKARIEKALGPAVQKDEELLKTLVYLTEFPTPIRGTFDKSYLELPKEILSTVMRHHQRYFSVLNPDGSLAPEFVAVTNTDGDPDGLIRQGNERVLRARFSDAAFFWRCDDPEIINLEKRVQDLEKVSFQAKLGSYRDKTERTRKLAAKIAEAVGADANTVDRAALLAKTDLTTVMVKEFPELQGVVGGLYAERKGQDESKAVAIAIYDHYQPVSMDAPIPRNLSGQVVSIADKLDTLRECFRVEMIPTGSKDPLALRRAAQGIVKILFEAKLPLDLKKYVDDTPQLLPFMLERINFYLREVGDYPYDEVNAVLAAPLLTLPDLKARIEAIHVFRSKPDFEPLVLNFKRINNILKKEGFKGGDVNERLLPFDGPERGLYSAMLQVKTLGKGIAETDYTSRLVQMLNLRPDVDLFFDKIRVIDPDPAIRENRLALLYNVRTEFSTIADFSEIVTQGASA